MISKQELIQIKEQKKTNLYYEEKEYLHYIFLNAISRFPEKFIFKGGTCLRICYGYERASEDLDFSTKLGISDIKEIIKKLLKEFDNLSINYNLYSIKEFKENIRFEVRFNGPLYNGSLGSTNTLKIDFNKSKAKYQTAKVVRKLFSDVPAFSIAVMSEKEILGEKIRALINRKQPRDLYDIWMLLQNKVEIDKELINKKLREENSKISNLKFPSKEEYQRDLKALLSYLPPYEQVKSEVEDFVKLNLSPKSL